MPYDGRIYRILIASPADVEEERELAVRVIQEWNDLYSYTRRVVLLPLRWETHAAPEYGTRPQEVINRAVVDQCDLLLGIFWTRIGTPTGDAESGTLEEIERTARAGKPIMLYFSKQGADPDTLDLGQVARLKKFKEQTYPNALTESYRSMIEFRDKLAKQLELKVRDLQRADESDRPPPLELGVLSLESGEFAQGTWEASVDLPVIDDLDSFLSANPDDKIRQTILTAVVAHKKKMTTFPVLLGIRNTGASGLRNVYLEVSVRADSEEVEVDDSPPGRYSLFENEWFVTSPFEGELGAKLARLKKEKLTKGEGGWTFSCEWGAIQAQRTCIIEPCLSVTVTSSARVFFAAKVFADSFPQPLTLDAEAEFRVGTKHVLLKQFIPDIDAMKGKIAAEGPSTQE